MQLLGRKQNDYQVGYNSFSIPLLRNLQKNEHKHMLDKIIPDFDKKSIDGKKDISTKNDPSYEKVQDYYNSFLRNDPQNLLHKIENEFVYSLAFDAVDEVLIFKVDDDFANLDTLESDLLFNKKVYQINPKKPDEKDSKLELLTIRKIKDKKANAILFIFSHGIYKTMKRNDKKSITFSCILDLNTSTLQIKYQSNYVKNLRVNYNKTLSDIIGQIIEIVEMKVPNIDIHNDKKSQYYERSIYRIFKDLSEESEEIIKKIKTNKNEPSLITNIEKFMSSELDINMDDFGFDVHRDELINSYTKRVLSIYYQNVATSINDNKTFQSYLYAFTFLSSDSTRSSTSKGNNDAIYKDDIFWRLKDLIHTTKRIKSLSVFERFNKNNHEKVYSMSELNILTTSSNSKSKKNDISEANKSLIESTLNIDYKVESMHGGMKLHYNNNLNTNFERGIKNDYVIAKIVKYL